MKSLLSHFSAALVAILTTLSASAQVINHDVNVGDFDKLIVQDNINVKYVQNAVKAGHVTFKSTKAVANCLIFVNNGKGKLKIEVAEDLLGKEKVPDLTIYSSNLYSCENDGDSTLIVAVPKGLKEFSAVSTRNGDTKLEQVDVEKLTVKIETGWGDIYASGKCNQLVVRGLGTGDLNVQELKARTANVRYTGTGVVRCDVTEELKVKGAGGAKVLCKKMPAKITKSKILRGIHLGLLQDEKK